MLRRFRDRVRGVRSRGKNWLAASLLLGLAAGLAMLTLLHRPATAGDQAHAASRSSASIPSATSRNGRTPWG